VFNPREVEKRERVSSPPRQRLARALNESNQMQTSLRVDDYIPTAPKATEKTRFRGKILGIESHVSLIRMLAYAFAPQPLSSS
jgi:hypothetical protein